MATRRSPYADLLLPFAGRVLIDKAPARQRGAWPAHFSARAGKAAVTAPKLILDIGCNDGVLLAAVAGEHPDCSFLGLDWSPRLLYHAAQRLALHPNVTLLHARAEDLPELFAPAELDAIWLFQPEPMQLTTRRPTRLFDTPFLLDCAAALKPGGTLTLKTDHPGYYQWALALLGAEPHPDFLAQLRGEARAKRKEFADPGSLPAPNEPARALFDLSANSPNYWADPAALALTAAQPYAGRESTYERRFRSKRLPIYLLELRRNETPCKSPGSV